MSGGYQNLLVYRLSVTLFDLNAFFCNLWINKKSRTHDQMIQAGRSGKQNIVEGSLEISVESNLKLTGVARASFGELIEDYKDFLRQNGLPLWDKNDPRVLRIRAFRESIEMPTNLTNLSNWTHLNFDLPENFANLMLCLLYKETYLLDQLIRSQQNKFVKEGGFRENLFRKRREYKSKFDQ